MISLDNRQHRDSNLGEEWSRCFYRRTQGTIVPRRILLAECDCEQLASRGHALEHTGYEVISCHDCGAVKRFLQWMIDARSDRPLIDLMICDINLLDDAVVDTIAAQQNMQTFPPLILINACASSQALQRIARLKSRGSFDQSHSQQRQLAFVRHLVPYPTNC